MEGYYKKHTVGFLLACAAFAGQCYDDAHKKKTPSAVLRKPLSDMFTPASDRVTVYVPYTSGETCPAGNNVATKILTFRAETRKAVSFYAAPGPEAQCPAGSLVASPLRGTRAFPAK